MQQKIINFIGGKKLLSFILIFSIISVTTFFWETKIVSAAVAFRSSSQTAAGTAANITGTEPSGAAENDILIAMLYAGGSCGTITPPAGWSNNFNGTAMQVTAVSAPGFNLYLYWIRRGTSSPSYVWTFSSCVRRLAIAAFSGALASGDPFSFGAKAIRDNGDALTYPDVSGTTAVNNELLVWFGNSSAWPTSGTQPTGFTKRLDILAGDGSPAFIADKAQASAGATGTVTGASYSGDSEQPSGSFLVGLEPYVAGPSIKSNSKFVWRGARFIIRAGRVIIR